MNLGMPEMIFIFLLALILFGPKKLPEIGREIGKFMAEFKRASDFKYQLQTEIEKVGVDAPPITQPGAQQSSSFTQTLLPPAVSSVISEIDTAHERLMSTARMAFDAQNFTLRPPQEPVVSSSTPVAISAPAEATSAIPAIPENSEVEAAPVKTSPVEATTEHHTPDSAPGQKRLCPAEQLNERFHKGSDGRHGDPHRKFQRQARIVIHGIPRTSRGTPQADYLEHCVHRHRFRRLLLVA
jgi:sec-independent protein translocase protein TatB